jgi:hypothetical protein
MGSNFFTYSGSSNNCQNFILGLLKGSGALTPEAQQFIKQDTEHLFENIPWTKRIMDTITDAAAKASIVVQGGDIPKHIITYPQFASYYYQNIAKPKGISYKSMMQSNQFKSDYAKFKATKNNK